MDKDVWKCANLDRKHFSKIQCDKNYHPKKKTVMALCIALELDLEQAKDLLARADWAFSPSSRVDLIVQKAITEQQYDLDRTLDEIRPFYHHVESCQQTVPEAIIAFLESEDYEDDVRNVISLGGDTDTLGAITGSIAEAYYDMPGKQMEERQNGTNNQSNG